MMKFLLIYILLTQSQAFSQADPLRDIYVSSQLDRVSEELRMQAAENEYWVFGEEELKHFESLSLGDFLKFKMPLVQGGVAERSYLGEARLNEFFGLNENLGDIVFNNSRINLSDTDLLNYIYNIPLIHISKIEYVPSMESFKYQTGAASGVLHIRTKKTTETLVSFARSTEGSANQFQALFAESSETASGRQSFSLSLYERARFDYSQNKYLRDATDRYTAPAASAVDRLEITEDECMATSGQIFINNECFFRLGSRQSYHPKRQGGFLNYSYEGVLSKWFIRSNIYLGAQREFMQDAYPRASFLKTDSESPLLNIDGSKQSLYLWRANSERSMESNRRLFYFQFENSFNRELANATDIGLNLSYQYSKNENSFEAYEDRLLNQFETDVLSSSLPSEDYDDYLTDSSSDGQRDKVLVEAYIWKEIMELGGGPMSLYSMIGYKYDKLGYANSNTDDSFGLAYKKAKAEISSGYLAADLFIPALHSLSIAWSGRLEGDDLNFYQRTFVDYKISKSIFRFAFSTGQRSASIKDKKLSSYNNEQTIYDASLNATNWIRYDVLANKNLQNESFKIFELGYHQSLFSSLDLDINLWSRLIDDYIMTPPMDVYAQMSTTDARISEIDASIYQMSVQPLNADYISKKGMDLQIHYQKVFSSSKIIIKERLSYIFEDFLKFKGQDKIDMKSRKRHPILRETLSISYDAKKFEVSFSEYSSFSTKQYRTDIYQGFTRAYSLSAAFKHKSFRGSVFVNDIGGERSKRDYSADSSARVDDSYSLISGPQLGVSLGARF